MKHSQKPQKRPWVPRIEELAKTKGKVMKRPIYQEKLTSPRDDDYWRDMETAENVGLM